MNEPPSKRRRVDVYRPKWVMLNLPYEVIWVIFQFLPLEYVLRYSRVSRTWCKAAEYHRLLDKEMHLTDLFNTCCWENSVPGVEYILDRTECRLVLGFQTIQHLFFHGYMYVDMVKCLMERKLLQDFGVNDLLEYANTRPHRNSELIEYLEGILNAKEID